MRREAREVGLRGRSHHSEDEVSGANSRLADGHDGAKIPAGVQLHERSAIGDQDRRHGGECDPDPQSLFVTCARIWEAWA